MALSVSDTDCGISPDIITKILQPFFATKDEGKGTGLGLSQVYGFATNCGGTARVLGTAATVTIYLPRAPLAPAEMKGVGQPEFDAGEQRREKRCTILLIENEENP